MAEDSLLKSAQAAAALAQRLGADEAKIGVSRSRGVDVEWRDGRLERVQERTRRSLSAEIYVDGRYSVSTTNDLRPDAMERFLADAVEMTRLLEADPCRGLPDPERYAGRADIDLELADPNYGELSSEARRKLAADLEQELRDCAGDLPIISVTTSVSDGEGESARVHTNGFEGSRRGTHFSISAMVTVKDEGDRRPMGWDYTSRRWRSDLDPTEALAKKAVERAAAQLGAGNLPTGKYDLVIINHAVPRLLGALLSPLSGSALQQKRSLWDGKLGEQIAHSSLTIFDEPHLVRGMGSGLYDGDGFATKRQPIIEAGVLRTYFIDQYYARKLQVEPSCGSTHNLDWTLGDKDLAELIADLGDGVLIERFLGGNSNETTGDISLGCAGRVIRNGQLAEPVSEVNLAGHFGELWMSLAAIGNDPNPNSSSACPSIVIEGVQLSGS